jgi:LysM repeat protein
MKTAALSILIGLLVLVGAGPALADDEAPNTIPYTIQPGDSLELIAAKFGTTVQVLIDANPFLEEGYEAGDEITIPTFQATYPTSSSSKTSSSGSKSGGSHSYWHGVYVVRWGDTLSGIARRFGVSTWALAHANGIHNPHYIRAGQKLVVPGGGYWHGRGSGYWHGKGGGFYYTVRWGDTLSSIAWRYGVSPWAIAHANKLHNPNRIYAGQALYIP